MLLSFLKNLLKLKHKLKLTNTNFRSSLLEMFLRKGVLKICSKLTGEHPYRRAISISMPKCDFNVEIAIRYGCSPVNLLHIFRTPFLRKSSGWLLMYLHYFEYQMMCCRCIFKFSNTKAQKAPLVLQQFDVPSINIQQ